MPGAEVQSRLADIYARHAARDEDEILRQEEELDAIELDEAAYRTGRMSEAQGELHQAARWYLAAAKNDFPNAALRLAIVYDALADRYLTSTGAQTAEEMSFVKRAAWWYAEAFAAGETEAAELLEDLSLRHDPSIRWMHGTPLESAANQLSRARANANGDEDADLLADTDWPHHGTETEPRRADKGCTLGGLENAFRLGRPERVDHIRACAQCRTEWTEMQAMLVGHVPAQAPR
jgi:hypothetical protein